MKTSFLLMLCLYLGLVSCNAAPTAPPATSVPTPDVAAIQTSAAISIFATQTASIPTPTPTRIATNTPQPTNTLEATSTPDFEQRIPPRQDYKHGYEIKEEYDRFKRITKVSLEPRFSDTKKRPGALAVLYSYPETTPTIPSEVDVAFLSVHDDWEYLECHDLTFLIDNQPLKVKTDHDGSVGSGYVVETVAGYINTDDFLTLVNAQKVEGQLCRDEFVLTNDQMNALKDVASRMQP
ncbi:MAG TPA: hypothetical protein VFD70_30910 [Anaerolineae bacterium]|nr:hypothetical protein [Anaerolineae bacterium]